MMKHLEKDLPGGCEKIDGYNIVVASLKQTTGEKDGKQSPPGYLDLKHDYRSSHKNLIMQLGYNKGFVALPSVSLNKYGRILI
jgi:hypothetical protein